jgi:dihydrolipoamide dehydrogenase
MVKDLIVIGGGPGGYTAAIRGAQLGASIALVEENHLGGTCLNWGCIPTKVHHKHAQLMETLEKIEGFGINLDGYSIDFARMQKRKTAVVEQLREGIHRLLKANGVELIFGKAAFREPGLLKIVTRDGSSREERAQNVIIATGSLPASLPVPGVELPGVVFSNELLSAEKIPSDMVVIGGGVVGLELAGIFKALGSRVVILEYMPNILPGFDTDLTKRLAAGLRRKGIQIETEMIVREISPEEEGLQVLATGKKGDRKYFGEKVLVSTGRKINLQGLNLDEVGVLYDSKGIKVNARYETTVPGIYAVGDVIGGLMLAHVAAEEGIAAVENIMGLEGSLNYGAVPSCVFTFPEVAVVGITEDGAREQSLPYVASKFMFGANGKALTMGEGEGFVKTIAEAGSGRLLGTHIMGPRDKELKLTPARKIMLEIFLSEEDKLQSALEIYDKVRLKNPRINFSTVYRNLEILVNTGLVEKVVFQTGANYKLLQSSTHRHHLICTACHKTEPLPFCPLRDLEEEVRRTSDFQPTEHKVEIYGICKNCRTEKP